MARPPRIWTRSCPEQSSALTRARQQQPRTSTRSCPRRAEGAAEDVDEVTSMAAEGVDKAAFTA